MSLFENRCKMSVSNYFRFSIKGAVVALAIASTLPLLSGCNQRLDQADLEYDASVSPYHRVRRNETLSTIARDYHMDKRELAQLNGLRPPFRIVVGQKLLVRSLRPSKRVSHDPYDMPATEGPLPSTGEVTVNKLAPLPGIQEDNIKIVGDQSSFENQNTPSTSENMPNDSSEDQAVEQPKEEAKVVKVLPQTPRSASFYTWPVKGRVIKGFTGNKKGKGGNSGIKIAAPQGTPVVAANNGVVARTRQVGGYGKVVLIKHDGGFLSIYSHMNEIKVKRGDVVQAGQQIGTVGKTGNAPEPQLHFEIRKNGGKTPVDPTTLLD